jgi:hypothetical protein
MANGMLQMKVILGNQDGDDDGFVEFNFVNFCECGVDGLWDSGGVWGFAGGIFADAA